MAQASITGQIPHIIHQTWKDARVPQRMVPWQESWRRNHPDWEYRLWTDADNRDLLQRHYPWLLPVYDNYREPVMRADAARCCILHHCGGVYADLDFESLRPLEPLLAGRTLLIGLEPGRHAQNEPARARGLEQILCNAFLASTPAHPFWDTVFAELLRRCREPETLDATGPFMLSAAWRQFPDRDPKCLADSRLLYPVTAEEAEAGQTERLLTERNARGEAFAVHHWEGGWIRRGVAARLARYMVHHSGLRTRALMRFLYPRLRDAKRFARRLLRRPHPHKAPVTGVETAPRRALSAEELRQNILITVPVKNAARFLPGLFAGLKRLTYPHQRLSLAFLESDSDDGTWETLQQFQESLQQEYRAVRLFRESFAYHPWRERNDAREQLRRRAILARSRNRLLQQALTDEDWVLWIDADVMWWPSRTVECLLAADRDIVVPHCITPEGNTFDLNTFRIREGMRDSDWAPHIRDGLLQPPRGFGRMYLDELRNGEGECVAIDAVGATMLLVRADLHRKGLIFPEAPYRCYIETEGLAMMARDMGVRCWGMPGLEIIHPLH